MWNPSGYQCAPRSDLLQKPCNPPEYRRRRFERTVPNSASRVEGIHLRHSQVPKTSLADLHIGQNAFRRSENSESTCRSAVVYSSRNQTITSLYCSSL